MNHSRRPTFEAGWESNNPLDFLCHGGSKSGSLLREWYPCSSVGQTRATRRTLVGARAVEESVTESATDKNLAILQSSGQLYDQYNSDSLLEVEVVLGAGHAQFTTSTATLLNVTLLEPWIAGDDDTDNPIPIRTRKTFDVCDRLLLTEVWFHEVDLSTHRELDRKADTVVATVPLMKTIHVPLDFEAVRAEDDILIRRCRGD